MADHPRSKNRELIAIAVAAVIVIAAGATYLLVDFDLDTAPDITTDTMRAVGPEEMRPD
jgi:hypothetical protein